MNTAPLLLTIPDAARQLALSRARLYELIADGTVPSVKIGGARRIRARDLAAYVDGLASDGAPGRG
ncbi:helix-turn-helix domain-containing protein [Curtobacterium pusillum]|uniref:helix-turn-helix domain-containing protein n=1 Tax=Curtobacterium pusillum TaxID=69373 RepID=UPI0011A241D0|nr:helix-turn-helix domain-containing protein [Curtobacterium pusillum]